MPLRTAGALCPDAVFLPVDGRKYQAVSREVMTILRRYTPLVEPISIDEAFLDVSGIAGPVRRRPGDRPGDPGGDPGRGPADGLGRRRDHASSWPRSPRTCASRTPWSSSSPGTRGGLPRATADPAAVGRRRANGGRPGRARRVDDGRPGRAARSDLLVRRFGKHGATLAHACPRASTTTRSATARPAKSISHEHTFDVDTNDPVLIDKTLLAMADGVAGRLRSAGLRAATVQVKIRDSSFRTITRQRTLAEPTDLAEPIWRTALELARPEIRGIHVRLLGRRDVRLRRARAADPVRGRGGRRGRPAAAGDRGRRRGPTAVRRASGDASPTARLGPAGALRARSDEAARATGPGMLDPDGPSAPPKRLPRSGAGQP